METLKLKAEKREEIGGLAPKNAIYKDDFLRGYSLKINDIIYA